MRQSTIHGLIGLFLFATGLVALYAVSSSRADGNVPVTMSPVIPTSPAQIEGVGPEVQQALTDTGRAEVLGADAMSQIPPEVAEALIENGVVLTVPAGGSR